MTSTSYVHSTLVTVHLSSHHEEFSCHVWDHEPGRSLASRESAFPGSARWTRPAALVRLGDFSLLLSRRASCAERLEPSRPERSFRGSTSPRPERIFRPPVAFASASRPENTAGD